MDWIGRVDVELQQQNQKLLGQMNQRANLQWRLQETVEGLSVVLLTYDGSQRVHRIAKATAGLHRLAPETITAVSIALVAALVAWGTWRMRRTLAAER
jgi:uncharacterized membrane-anchored protein